MDERTLRRRLTEILQGEGFVVAAVADAEEHTAARGAALRGLAEGRFAGMAWMTEGWLTRATAPGEFLPGCRSLVVVGLPNHSREPTAPPGDGARGLVARYAWGRDYHRVFEGRLRRVTRRVREELGGEARATVDYGPLLERPFAAAAGLGWQGKSTMLLVPGYGPWVMLGVIATTLAIEPDRPLRKSCGSCTRCITACPTGAIGADGGEVDARLCISYHTIENRGVVPRELRPKFGGWVFGCDGCLDACPVGADRWDADPEFAARSVEDARPLLRDLLHLDVDAFRARYAGTAVMRAKRDGLVRNACIALGNTGTAGDLPALREVLDDGSALVRGHAAWALGALGARLGEAETVGGWLRARYAVETDAYVREEIAWVLDEG